MLQDERTQRALEYERDALANRADELQRQTRQESLEWMSRFVEHGHTGRSSPMMVHLLRQEVDRFRALIRFACETRLETARTVRELADPEMLASLGTQLNGRIDAEWNAIPHSVAALVGGPGEEPAVRAILNSPRFDTELILIRNEVERRLRLIEHGMALGMHAPSPPGSSITVNISSTVGALNLGTITGNMNTNLGYLQREGPTGAEVARAIARLTEAVANAGVLPEESRAEVVESLAAIAQEAVLPPDRRKRLVVRGLLERMGLILATGAQVAEIWNAAHPVIASWFGR